MTNVGSATQMLAISPLGADPAGSTGPIVTTNKEGSTQKKMGNTSFTASFAARSSARWRAMVRR